MAHTPVTLIFDASQFVAGMEVAAASAGTIAARWTLCDATWEPHDWSDFD